MEVSWPHTEEGNTNITQGILRATGREVDQKHRSGDEF